MTPSTEQSASRPRVARWRRSLLPLVVLLGAVLLGGCTAPTFGAFRGATTQGRDTFKLWVGMFIAGLVVAAIVYGLIFWATFAYRRRGEGIPRQFHANIPLEILYTAIPVVIVAGIFYFTVLTENNVDAVSPHPSEIVHVLAYRWGWQFTYADGAGRSQGVLIRTSSAPSLLPKSDTSPEYPQLVLPKGETVRIVLNSADVVHGFYVRQFLFSRYAQPGVTNVFDITPTETGLFNGQCTQYCGLYHSEMLFSVRVVSPAAFEAWLSHEQASQATSAAGAIQTAASTTGRAEPAASEGGYA